MAARAVSVGPWPRLARFEITCFRRYRYRYRGELRSYLRASCPVPKHFTAGFLSFARATWRQRTRERGREIAGCDERGRAGAEQAPI